MPSKIDTSFIPDVPKGPLSEYRQKAKFDWKRLRIIFEEEELLRVKYKVWEILEKDPLFAKSRTTIPMDQLKRITAMRKNKTKQLNIFPDEVMNLSYEPRIKYLMSVDEALYGFCPSLSVKIALGISLFINTILAMGTERHKKYLNIVWNRELVTCIAITEVSHGSNTKCIRTTAKYDKNTKEFIINTPDFQAAKCWIGNLGKTASIALTFANLYTPDGINHGLHAFIVPIRNPKNLMTYPGILIGDIGEKIGLNGIDNGFIMFSNYRIPRENLLNRTGDVSPDGIYESVFTEPEKILGAALEALSAGRIGVMLDSVNTISHAAIIAVRYAAVRKQFGPDINGPELPILEYPLHQWRILPYLAAACVFQVSVRYLRNIYLNTIRASQTDTNGLEILSQKVSEIHAIITCSKPLLTWTTRDALQETREACGGYGYLKSSNIGELRNNHDVCCTYEGDNNVLGQQASNWLIRQWTQYESPLGTADFVLRRQELLKMDVDKVLKNYAFDSMDFIIECYNWLMCFLLNKLANLLAEATKAGINKFDARNNTQVYCAKILSLAFAERFMLITFKEYYLKSDITNDLKYVLNLLCLIYGYWSIDKHMATFYQGEFSNNSKFADLIRSNLIEKCKELKDIAVSVSDAIAPPDFILNSIIAKADGRLYDNLEQEFMTYPGAFERPTWWKDILTENHFSKL